MDAGHRLSAAAIGQAAARALHDELALAPKPGLVSFVDAGSHTDMDAGTFVRSIAALQPFLRGFAALGAAGSAFRPLELQGIRAEAAMLAATGGVNTHRGAIFILGLLCAAVGRVAGAGHPPTAARVRAVLRTAWGEELARRASVPRDTHGARAVQRHGLRGVGAEAADGFPVLFDRVLPELQRCARRGWTPAQGRTNALFAAMACIDDTTLVHRGGIAALADVKRGAAEFLGRGGAGAPGADAQLQAMHRAFVARRLSPGGAADLLSAACFLQAVCAPAD